MANTLVSRKFASNTAIFFFLGGEKQFVHGQVLEKLLK